MLNRFFLLFSFLMCCVVASAQHYLYKNGVQYTEQDANVVHVTGFTSQCPKDVVIPSILTLGPDSYVVKEIEDGAFTDCTVLESIQIPAEIVRIGSVCFVGCKNLESISLDGYISLEKTTFLPNIYCFLDFVCIFAVK